MNFLLEQTFFSVRIKFREIFENRSLKKSGVFDYLINVMKHEGIRKCKNSEK